jgi:ubiquinone/menaquinone biosynthesis C-methylase UbiE
VPLLDDVVEHYGAGVEEGRLHGGPGLVERDRTRALVLARVPKPPAVVLDVGGGPGVHAVWLRSLGYEVHLVDAMPLHVEQARAALERTAGGRYSATVGDARALDAVAASADVVLLCGPLYHLTDPADRARALAEAHRVLRPEGWLFAAGISRFASALDGMARGLLDDPEFVRIMERDLADGQHRNPSQHPDYFATAYFHRPEELLSEVSGAGFTAAEVVGLEGPAWLLPDIGARWADERRRELLLGLLDRLGREPALLGASAHLLAIAQKT